MSRPELCNQDGITYEFLTEEKVPLIPARSRVEDLPVGNVGPKKHYYTFKHCKLSTRPEYISVSTTGYWNTWAAWAKESLKKYLEENPDHHPDPMAHMPRLPDMVIHFRWSQYQDLDGQGGYDPQEREPMLEWTVPIQEDVPEKTEVERAIGHVKQWQRAWAHGGFGLYVFDEWNEGLEGDETDTLTMVLEGWRVEKSTIDGRLAEIAVEMRGKQKDRQLEDVEFGRKPFLCHHFNFQFDAGQRSAAPGRVSGALF